MEVESETEQEGMELRDWKFINHDKWTAIVFDENLGYDEQFREFFNLTWQKQKIPV